MRGRLTARLQSGLARIAPPGSSRQGARNRITQIVRELSRIDSVLLNVLPDSLEHSGRDSADDCARIVAADPRDVTHSLRHRIVVIAKDLRKRRWPLRIFCLRGGFAMNGDRAAGIRVGRHCGSHEGNRRIHRPLRNDWINPKPLAHLLDSRSADLLLNLFLN